MEQSLRQLAGAESDSAVLDLSDFDVGAEEEGEDGSEGVDVQYWGWVGTSADGVGPQMVAVLG